MIHRKLKYLKECKCGAARICKGGRWICLLDPKLKRILKVEIVRDFNKLIKKVIKVKKTLLNRLNNIQ